MAGFVGTKIGMTQVFGEDGEMIPVTVLATAPCTVVQVRTRDRDGYEAIQVGFGKRRPKRVPKPLRGHMAKAGETPFAGLVEFRVDDASVYQVGQTIAVEDVFRAGDFVDVSGVTKGKGFQGVVRRYRFAGHSSSHGTHESFRGPGSVGAGSFPGRIWKGKRMAGHMGSRRRAIQNLEVVAVRPEEGVMVVRGSVPGARGDAVLVHPAIKKRSGGGA